MYIKPIVTGLATYIPGLYKFAGRNTGGTTSARYCYSVWLRHLVFAHEGGLPTQPHTIAELGPGDSLGIGLAALISGVEKYYALDVMRHANSQRNVQIFDELVTLFQNRATIPGPDELPMTRPLLDSYRFPHQIMTEARLNQALNPTRLANIRNELLHPGDNTEHVTYFVPWYDPQIIEQGSVDMILSQAVLEHVRDLAHTYHTMSAWLKPNGFMSHQVDFKCHGLAREWNGHWRYPDPVWKIVQGRRAYLLNRETHSRHIDLLRQNHFDIVCDRQFRSTSVLLRKDLAAQLRNIPDDDLQITDAFFLAVKSA